MCYIILHAALLIICNVFVFNFISVKSPNLAHMTHHSVNASDLKHVIGHADELGALTCYLSAHNLASDANLALRHACLFGANEIVAVLIDYGVNVNLVFVDWPIQETLLYASCEFAHAACVDLLLAHGAATNVGELMDGTTPLMSAVNFQRDVELIDFQCKIVRSLLAAGAYPGKTSGFGATPLMYSTTSHSSRSMHT